MLSHTRRSLNRLADSHNRGGHLNIQRVARGVGELRAQIRRTYDKTEKQKKVLERVDMLGRQLQQSETLAKLYSEKIDFLVETWPILRGIVNENNNGIIEASQHTRTVTKEVDAPVWAFTTLASTYCELTLEKSRIYELSEAIRDATNEAINLEMDVCELHTDISNIAKAYSKTNVWLAFPYEACAECLERTSSCDMPHNKN